MRVFRDLEMVEYLGSGIPRILTAYPKESFRFTDHFIRMVFPASAQVTPEVTPEVRKLIDALDGEMRRVQIQEKLDLKDNDHFREQYLVPAMAAGLIEMTIPDKPNSRLQKYRLTEAGIKLKDQNKK